MCPVCRMLLYCLCLVVCMGVGGLRSVEKGGSGCQAIVRGLACLPGGGIGCGIVRKRVTCSRVGGASVVINSFNVPYSCRLCKICWA
jgi:hypothetical protein